MKSDKTRDIMIIGGGPAGSTAAFLLASRGYSVILADKQRFPRPKLCAGLLTWKSIDLIQSIFNLSEEDLIEQGLISHRTQNYRIYHGVSEIARKQLDYPFHFIERLTYDHYWLQKAVEAGAQTITGQTVRHVEPETGRVTLSSGTHIRARVVIGADGVWSIARRSIFGRPQTIRNWNNQLAMTLECRLPHNDAGVHQNYAALHFGFVPWGYAWSFPNRHHQIVGIAGLRHKNDQPLTAAFDRFLTSIGVNRKEFGTRKAYPLPMGNYLDPPGRGRVLLVGDACGLADPLLGEGIYYAHRSAVIAAQAVMRCGPGNADLAQCYQRALADQILCELRWIKVFRNLLYAGGRRRRFRGLKLFLRIMPKRLEAAVQGQISFSRLLQPGGRSTCPKNRSGTL